MKKLTFEGEVKRLRGWLAFVPLEVVEVLAKTNVDHPTNRHPLPWSVSCEGDTSCIRDADDEKVLEVAWDGKTELGINQVLNFICDEVGE